VRRAAVAERRAARVFRTFVPSGALKVRERARTIARTQVRICPLRVQPRPPRRRVGGVVPHFLKCLPFFFLAALGNLLGDFAAARRGRKPPKWEKRKGTLSSPPPKKKEKKEKK
jgi:hypothetical protein